MHAPRQVVPSATDGRVDRKESPSGRGAATGRKGTRKRNRRAGSTAPGRRSPERVAGDQEPAEGGKGPAREPEARRWRPVEGRPARVDRKPGAGTHRVEVGDRASHPVLVPPGLARGRSESGSQDTEERGRASRCRKVPERREGSDSPGLRPREVRRHLPTGYPGPCRVRAQSWRHGRTGRVPSRLLMITACLKPSSSPLHEARSGGPSRAR